MVVAEQVGKALLAVVGDGLLAAATQVAHNRERLAKGGQRAVDGRTEFGLVLGSDLDRVQDPVGPAVQTQQHTNVPPLPCSQVASICRG